MAARLKLKAVCAEAETGSLVPDASGDRLQEEREGAEQGAGLGAVSCATGSTDTRFQCPSSEGVPPVLPTESLREVGMGLRALAERTPGLRAQTP